MKAVKPYAKLIDRRTASVATLGALAFGAHVACSVEPAPNPGPMFTAGTSGVVPFGGTPGASGAASTTGGTFNTSGTGFGTAGTETAGTGGIGGTDTGGTAGAPTAGTGGTPPIIVVPPFCEGKTPTALPFDVQTAFYESAWQGDFSQISIPTFTLPADDACMQRAPGALGHCSKWRYTPNVTAATWAAVAWVNRADAAFTHEPVCLATGATRISFFARGAIGGEVISVAGGGAVEIPITLTTEWQEYEVPLAGVTYTTPEGVSPNGFSWKVDPVPAPGVTPVVGFFIDSIRFVTTPLVGNGGGEGGSGAGGDSGAGGAN